MSPRLTFTFFCLLSAAATGLANPDASSPRTSANGTRLPLGTAALTVQVWCYDAGANSLVGQPGIVDVVKGIRPKPLKEWNIVYYDPKRVTPNAIVAQLRQTRCPDATAVDSKVEKVGPAKLILQNPLACNGDLLHFIVELPKGEKATLAAELPNQWNLAGPTTLKHGSRFEIQTHRQTQPGTHEVKLRVKTDQGEEEVAYEVNLVHRAKLAVKIR